MTGPCWISRTLTGRQRYRIHTITRGLLRRRVEAHLVVLQVEVEVGYLRTPPPMDYTGGPAWTKKMWRDASPTEVLAAPAAIASATHLQAAE